MHNRTVSMIPSFSTHQPNMDIPLNDIAIKVHKYTKYEIKVHNLFKFVVCLQYFNIFPSIMCVDSKVVVVKSHHGIS